MKTVIAFIAGVIIASGTAYFFLSGRAVQPAATQFARVQVPLAEPEKPAPAPIEAGNPAPEPAAAQVERKPVVTPLARKPLIERRPQAAPARPPAAVETAAVVPQPEPVQPPQPVATPAPVSPAPRPESEWKPFTPERTVTPPPPPVERSPNIVTLAANTPLVVRLAETVSTEKQQAGDIFSATLDQPLVVDGWVVAERGSRIEGRVVSAVRAGRVRGTAQLELELSNLSTADGQHLRIRTNTYLREGETSRSEDAQKVGIGAAIGAAIGAIAGGGKGAAIGAGAGGAAGAGTVAATRGKAAVLPIETRVTFRLTLPITVTERLP